MSDDQGWGDLGNRHEHLQTPNLDEMTRNGLEFTRFYAAAPVCSPTRGSMLTGRHPYRYGIFYANSGHLPPSEVTLPEVLKENGYLTGHFGKWHLGIMDKYVIEGNRGGKAENQKHFSPPWTNGYDVCFATESKVPTWDPMINPPQEVSGSNKKQKDGDSFGVYYWEGDGKIATSNLDGDDSRVIMDRVLPFIEKAEQNNQPFFTTIWFHTPHSPVVAGEKYRKMYAEYSLDHQHYYGSITAMDEQIGRLRTKLRELEIHENTLIWFCSDNGPAARGGGPGLENGGRQQGSNGGLRGMKGTLYEGGIRVPGIIEWPEIITKPVQTDFPSVTSDILPTILELLNLELPKGVDLDGRSIGSILKGEKITKRNSPIGFQSRFRGNEFKVWMEDNLKLVHIVKEDSWELYDLEKDPFEKNPIQQQFPDQTEKMKAALLQWIDQTNTLNQKN